MCYEEKGFTISSKNTQKYGDFGRITHRLQGQSIKYSSIDAGPFVSFLQLSNLSFIFFELRIICDQGRYLMQPHLTTCYVTLFVAAHWMTCIDPYVDNRK